MPFSYEDAIAGKVPKSTRKQFSYEDAVAGKIPSLRRSVSGRVIHTDSAGNSFSEKTVTVPVSGKWVTFPSVKEDGTTMSEDEVISYITRNGPIDPITGEQFPVFDDMEGAVRYAKQRSQTRIPSKSDPNEIVERGKGPLSFFGKERDGDVTLALPEWLHRPLMTIRGVIDGEITPENITGEQVMELGALLSGGAPGVVRSVARPKALSPGQESVAAAQRLDVDLPRAAASDSMITQQMAKTSTNMPIVGTPLVKAATKAIDDLEAAAKGIQDDLGSGSVKAAGDQLQSGVEDFITNVTSKRVTAKYDAVEELTDPTKLTPLVETRAILFKLASERKSAALPEQGPAAKLVAEAAGREQGLSFGGIRKLRTFVREQIDKPDSALPANTSKAELKRLHTALSDDLRTAVKNAGGDEALRKFNFANNFAAKTAETRKTLNQLLTPKSGESAFSRFIGAAQSGRSADINLLRKARAATDRETWKEISSATISQLGKDQKGDFSPARFLTQYGKLSEDGKKILFASTGDPGIKRALDDIATVSRQFQKLERFANPSGTAQGALGALGAVSPFFIDPATLIAAVTSTALVNRYLAKPAVVKSMSRWSKAYLALAAGKRGAIDIFNRTTRALAVEIANDAGMPELEQRIEQELRNAVYQNRT